MQSWDAPWAGRSLTGGRTEWPCGVISPFGKGVQATELSPSRTRGGGCFSTAREQRHGMARDHQLLIGAHDVEPDATIRTGDRGAARRIGLRIEHGPEPCKLLHDAGAHGG